MNIKKHITTILTSLLYIDIFTNSEGLSIIKNLSEATPTNDKPTLDSFEKSEKNTVFYRDDTTDKEQKTITSFLNKIANTGSLTQQNILNNMLQRADISIINYVVANHIFDIDMNNFSKFQEQFSLFSSQRTITTVDSQKTDPPVLSELQEQSSLTSSQIPVTTVDSQNTTPPVLDEKQSASTESIFSKRPCVCLVTIISLSVASCFYFKPKKWLFSARDSNDSVADRQSNSTLSGLSDDNSIPKDLQRGEITKESLPATATSLHSNTKKSDRPPTRSTSPAEKIDKTPKLKSTRTKKNHPHPQSSGELMQSMLKALLPHAVAAMSDERSQRSSTSTNSDHTSFSPGVSVASQNSQEIPSPNSEISRHVSSSNF